MAYNKHKNIKTTIDGMTFDSRKEARRYCELKILGRAGEIEHLQRQVPFELIPAKYEPDAIGSRGGVKRGKCIERAVTYIADFVYRDKRTGELVVEDVKGYKEGLAYQVFSIKRKLMLHVHNIKVVEI